MGLFSFWSQKAAFQENGASQKRLTEKEQEEAGVIGDMVFANFNNEIARADKTSIKDYRKMRDTDGTVDSLYNITTLPILATTFGVRAAEDDVNEEQAEFIRRSLFMQPYLGGMDVPFSLVLEQMLHAVIDGFEVFERVYKLDEDGRIVLKKLALRDATTVTIKVDKNGGYDGIRQQATFGSRTVDVVLPAYKTFLFTYGKSDNQYYGRSAFKSCYRNWDKKQKLEYLDSISIQNSAVKPKILQRISEAVVSTGEDRTNALKALSKLGKLNPVASIPHGFDVKELQGGDNSNVNESIERQNSEMARSFLASFSLLGSQGSSSVGSYALSADQSDLFMIALKGVMNLIVEHINQYWIADLIDLNFPVGQRHYPEFYFDDLTESNLELLKNTFVKLIEKDRISDEVVAGIEQKIANQFDIEPTKRETEQKSVSDSGINRQKNTNNGQNPENNAENRHKTTQNTESKEDNGAHAGKFQEPIKDDATPADDQFRREALPGEEKVNFSGILKQGEKICSNFEKEALPLLEDYIRKVAERPSQKIELPTDYVELVRKTYKTAYNYGKLSASDEEGVKAPKTTEREKKHTEDYVNFIVKKQVAAIEDLILEKKMQIVSEGLLTDLISSGALALASQLVNGTSASIFSQGMSAGRSDAYAEIEKTSEDDEAVYMWSALMENTCATCAALDESVYTPKEASKLRYQPGFMHLNCKCIWVRMTGTDKPKPTGLPHEVDDVHSLQITPRSQLVNMGAVGDGETKANAIRRATYNNSDDGETIVEVSNAIRSQDYETLAVFDKQGHKIVDYTSHDVSAIQVSSIEDFEKFIRDNEGAVSIHNHPGGRSFSLTDILNSGELQEIRVVSKYADYSLKVGEKGWGDPEKVTAVYENAREKYQKQAAAMFNAGKFKTELEAERWLSDNVIGAVAKAFGYKYNRKVR